MRSLCLLPLILLFFTVQSQTPKPVSSAEILQQLKRLDVHGAVLYIAAHPDDENTRLLSYLANEKLYRTGYLSLTRGDGGQNLIGDEQGIDLGLIRTQELLAARRVDGAEQFFTRAYDFGYSKDPNEALRIWGHEKVLSDVVWIIRSFRPDVVITRFPTTGEGGHGHHTASALLAVEAYEAAADPKKFPEQLKDGITAWQVKSVLWNNFNFGANNTIKNDQFKVDVGGYNPILGRSYGEMAAESRSNHRSQGFGVPAQRGSVFEHFTTLKGTAPSVDLFDNIDVTSNRLFGSKSASDEYKRMVQALIKQFDPSDPSKSISGLQALDKHLNGASGTQIKIKQAAIRDLIRDAAGLFMEVTSVNQLNAIGDSATFNIFFNNRSGVPVSNANVRLFDKTYNIHNTKANISHTQLATVLIPKDQPLSTPYWLQQPMSKGAFTVTDQQQIGRPQITYTPAIFNVSINGINYSYLVPVVYKSTDPVKGETYQPMQFIPPVVINSSPSVIILPSGKNQQKFINYSIQANMPLKERVTFRHTSGNKDQVIFDSTVNWKKGDRQFFSVPVTSNGASINTGSGQLTSGTLSGAQGSALQKISYEHIPDIFYPYIDSVRIITLDLATAGKRAGYIAGAGDRVPEALQQMGYTVNMLQEQDIYSGNLDQYDVIITGIRAYNIHPWLSNAYPALMQYVSNGGVLLSQYNTNNSIGPVRSRISPYPFTISRNRITDETAAVTFLQPDHPALNYPNKITQKDFEGWIQERSIYHAENIDSSYQRILSMKDPGEKEHEGSLIISNYGKGRFVYTGLVFFRELPAGVPGAYRLFANLIANNRK